MPQAGAAVQFPASAEINVKKQASCRLEAVALKQRLGRGERTTVDAVMR
jgi:hypothetical protein